MSLLSIVRVAVGEVSIKPGTIKMVSTDSINTITTAGYLNGIGGQMSTIDIAPSDVVECLYSYNPITDSGVFALLGVSISNGIITLSAGAGIEALESAHIFVGNAANIATDVAMSGDISINNAGVTSIVAGVIVNADINAAAAISFSKLAALPSAEILVGSAGNVATAVAMSGDVTISNTGVTALGAGVIVNADINAAAAIAFSKLAALTSGNLLIGSAGNVATAVAMSGDATMVASGALTIASAAVTLSKLAAGVAPAAVIKFMNQVTSVGGSASEAFTVTGAVAGTDRAFVQLVNDGTNNVSVLSAVVTTNTLTVTFSGDPGNDTVINYQLVRAAS